MRENSANVAPPLPSKYRLTVQLLPRKVLQRIATSPTRLSHPLSQIETVIQITNADTAGFVIMDALQLLPIEPELKTNE
jgi:hypothetical protein